MSKPYDPNDPSTWVAISPSCYCDPNSPNYCGWCMANVKKPCGCAPGSYCTYCGQIQKASPPIPAPYQIPTGNYTISGTHITSTGVGTFVLPSGIIFNPDMLVSKSATPMCCGETARWVNNGIGFRYYFCDQCKDEVEHFENDPTMSK